VKHKRVQVCEDVLTFSCSSSVHLVPMSVCLRTVIHTHTRTHTHTHTHTHTQSLLSVSSSHAFHVTHQLHHFPSVIYFSLQALPISIFTALIFFFVSKVTLTPYLEFAQEEQVYL
jgi:hypothetical protein